MSLPTSTRRTVLAIGAACLAACAPVSLDRRSPAGLEQIENIVVIYAENRSFDHLYGLFPGAEGIAQATAAQKTQLDHDGTPLPNLPPVYEGGKASDEYPKGLPNGPFRIDSAPVNRNAGEVLPSPIHDYYQNREQINSGLNNKFVAMSTAGAWVMGYWDGSQMKLWKWAREYTLADHFFMSAFGGSYLNHQWLICACTPVFADAPARLRPQLDAEGRLKKQASSPASVMNGPVQVFDGSVTPDGFTVNTLQAPYQPSGIPPAGGQSGFRRRGEESRAAADGEDDRRHAVSGKGVSWAWYAGGWNAALADGRQEPKAGRAMSSTTPSAANWPSSRTTALQLLRALRARHGRPRAAPEGLRRLRRRHRRRQAAGGEFLQTVGRLNQHPSYTDLAQGDAHIDAVLTRLRASPLWPKMAVIVTYDENGGYWDHMPPPQGHGWGDRWGPGTRMPALIVSPFARRGFVDKTPTTPRRS